MDEMQWVAAKKAAIAVVCGIALVAVMRVNPVIGILSIFLIGIGLGSFMIFLDIEQSKKRAKEYEKRMSDLAKMRSERNTNLDKIDV